MFTSLQSVEDPTINLLLIMILIWVSGVVFRKLKQPPMLGELLGGFVFGPSVLGVISPDATIECLAELGVFFLMFYAGLETNPNSLKRMGKLAMLVGIGGFLLPFVAGFWLCVLVFGIDGMQAMFIGLALSITAIAVNARILNDLHLCEYQVAPVIIGASIVDDVLSFAVFSSLIGLATGASAGAFDAGAIIHIIFRLVLFFGITICIGLQFYPRLSKYFSSRESMGFTFALVVALVFGLIAEITGLHIILGAYMAGLFVKEGIVNKDLMRKINDRFVSITYGFLGPIFFVSLSFHMTLDIFSTHLSMIMVVLLVAIVGKLIGAGIGARMGGLNTKETALVAISMNGRGAVELIIASVGIELGIINDVYFSILVVMAFITTLIPPVAMGALLNRYGYGGLQKLDNDDGPC
ncbi:MAG: cation:proton antiporter [Proteobacteria bacterium]|nr:cation:proton antiporter [Pseudomonadota bacterium]